EAPRQLQDRRQPRPPPQDARVDEPLHVPLHLGALPRASLPPDLQALCTHAKTLAPTSPIVRHRTLPAPLYPLPPALRPRPPPHLSAALCVSPPPPGAPPRACTAAASPSPRASASSTSSGARPTSPSASPSPASPRSAWPRCAS